MRVWGNHHLKKNMYFWFFGIGRHNKNIYVCLNVSNSMAIRNSSFKKKQPLLKPCKNWRDSLSKTLAGSNLMIRRCSDGPRICPSRLEKRAVFWHFRTASSLPWISLLGNDSRKGGKWGDCKFLLSNVHSRFNKWSSQLRCQCIARRSFGKPILKMFTTRTIRIYTARFGCASQEIQLDWCYNHCSTHLLRSLSTSVTEYPLE
jgi:hypothetical protein